jgi:hypothetical protein
VKPAAAAKVVAPQAPVITVSVPAGPDRAIEAPPDTPATPALSRGTARVGQSVPAPAAAAPAAVATEPDVTSESDVTSAPPETTARQAPETRGHKSTRNAAKAGRGTR